MIANFSMQWVESVEIKRKHFREELGHSQDFDTVELVVTDRNGQSCGITLYTTADGLKNLGTIE